MFKAIGWLSGKLNDGTSAIGRAVVTRFARQWAEGKRGPQGLYYFLSRHSTQITATLGTLAAVLVLAAQWPDLLELVGLSTAAAILWGERLAYAAPVLVEIKLASDQWHSIERPKWLDHPVAIWLAEHGTINTLVFSGLWGMAKDCGDGGWCDLGRWAIAVLGLACAHFRFISSAASARPPADVLKALAGEIAAPTRKVAAQAAEIERHDDAAIMKGILADAIQESATGPVGKAFAKEMVDSVGQALTAAK